ncbi:MAG: calcium-binding protein [Hyphomicrobiaceae bacterium]
MSIITGNNLRNKLMGTAAADTIFGYAGNDILDGGNGNDILRGGLGNDTLGGGAGNDKLYGEAGNDTLKGDAGADRLDGGTGTDTLTFASVSGATGVTIALNNSLLTAGVASGDNCYAIENLVGTSNNDFLGGTSGANTISGGAGQDSLYGYAGADILNGGAGQDQLYPGNDTDADHLNGGDDYDSVVYFDSTIGVIVNLETGLAGGGAANDVYSGIEIVIGSDTAGDQLTAGNGGRAYGAGGNDVLSGSSATGINPFTSEYLEGGDGADTFVLHLGRGFDMIGDFDWVEADKLQVSDAEFGVGAGPVSIRNAASGDIVADAAGPQFIFDKIQSNLYFDSDGTGTSDSPVHIALLVGFTLDLVAGDFVAVA